jgi:hypothetical protein
VCIEEDERGEVESSRVEASQVVLVEYLSAGNRGDQGDQGDQGYMRKRELKKDEHKNEDEDEDGRMRRVLV